MKQSSFDCGHVIAEANGGSATEENLRPVCSLCNKSMRTMNMEDFKKSFKSAAVEKEKKKIEAMRQKAFEEAKIREMKSIEEKEKRLAFVTNNTLRGLAFNQDAIALVADNPTIFDEFKKAVEKKGKPVAIARELFGGKLTFR